MATIANLDVNLRANVASYQNKMGGATKTNDRFARSADTANESSGRFAGAMKVAGAAVAAFVVAGVAAAGTINKIVQEFATVGDEIAKSSKQLQLSTTDYQSLSYAIERNGGSSNTLKTAIRGLTRNYFDLERGLSTAKDSFAELGLTQRDLEGKSTAEQFRIVVSRLNGITDSAKKAAVAQKVFGRSGLELLPVVNNLEQAEKRFRSLGLEVGPDVLKISEDIKDANQELNLSWQKLSAQLTRTFGPTIVRITNALAKMIRDIVDGWDELQKRIIKFRFGYQIQGITPQAEAALREFRAAEASGTLPGFDGKSNKQAPATDNRLSGYYKQIGKWADRARDVVNELRNTNNRLAPLPPALQKGSAAQIGFIQNLKRQREQSQIEAREKKKLTLAEQQLKNLEEILKEQKKTNKSISGAEVDIT